MRVEVVTADNASHFTRDLEQTFRQRHSVLVEEQGWAGLGRADGRDVDRFDDARATYVLVFEGGEVVGGQRLYPTSGPHLMTEAFESLVARPLPCGEHVREVTRHFVIREKRAPRVSALLMAATLDHCFAHHVTSLTAVVEAWTLPAWQQAGCETRPLGLPGPIEGRPCIAVEVRVTADSRARLGRIAGIPDAAALSAGPIATREPPVIDARLQ